MAHGCTNAPVQLGYVRTDLRRKLVEAVLRGEKTAAAGLHADDEPVPRVGGRCLLLGYDDEPVAVVETTEVRVLRVGGRRPRVRAGRGRGLHDRRRVAAVARALLGRSGDRRRHPCRRGAIQAAPAAVGR